MSKFPVRVILLVVLGTALVGCAHQGANAVLKPHLLNNPPSFTGSSAGINRPLMEALEDDGVPVDSLTMGLGSGLMGFDSVTVHRSGKVKVVWEDASRQTFYQAETKLPEDQVAVILDSPQVRIWKMTEDFLNPDAHDGAQGFVHCSGRGYTLFTFLSNNFPGEYETVWKRLRVLVNSVPVSEWKQIKKSDAFKVYHLARKM